jgi:hypothetical protein
MSYDDVDPAIAMMATQSRHVTLLRRAMLGIRHQLEVRAEVHDLSKLGPEELPGFVRINATARNFAYGSAEYRASIRAEKPAVEHHQKSNSHHPEFHADLAAMPWLDIVEMVCDWWAASQTYGTTPWDEVLRVQKERWPWPPEQWWLIEQVSRSLNENSGAAKSPVPPEPGTYWRQVANGGVWFVVRCEGIYVFVQSDDPPNSGRYLLSLWHSSWQPMIERTENL